ncbi:MAG: hypothetical protein IPF53_01005 [Blastocatellia bacterium]|nr:hypothetical protein [Blastocatellia bacterium]
MKVHRSRGRAGQIAVLGVASLTLVLGSTPFVVAKKAPEVLAKQSVPVAADRTVDLKQDAPGAAFEAQWDQFQRGVAAKRGTTGKAPIFGDTDLVVRFSAITGSPRLVYGDLGEAPAASKRGDQAMLWMQQNEHVFGFKTSELTFARSFERPSKPAHLYYDQKFAGLPVFYGEVGVHIGPDGHVWGVTNTFAPVNVRSTQPAITQEAAYETALAAINVTSASQLVTEFPSERTLGIWPTADGGRLAWKIVVSARAPVGLWEVIVDAATGEAIEPPLNRMCTVDGAGKVFMPNPIVSSGVNNLTDASVIAESEYFSTTLTMNTGTSLIGPHCQVHPSHPNPATRTTPFDYSDLRRTNVQFDQEQVFWAIAMGEQVYQSLGYTVANGAPLMNFSIKYYAHGSPTWGNQDNSSFSGNNVDGTGTGILEFGTGGVDDALDSEIVWHEWGHATFWNARPGINQNVTKVPLWDYDNQVGANTGLDVALEALFLMDLSPTQVEGAAAMITADMMLNGGATAGQINNAFKERGTVAGTVVPVVHTPGITFPGSGSAFLRNSSTSGPADIIVGLGTSAMTEIVGDWDGNGSDTIGAFLSSAGAFFLRNSNTGTGADAILSLGPGGSDYVPVVGDWDGNGTETIGVYNTTGGFFFLKNSNTPGPADVIVSFGPGGAGILPIVGDWDGNGTDTIGLFIQSSGAFLLKNSNTPGGADLLFSFGPGGATWYPTSGDWNADNVHSIGVYDSSTGTFFLKNTNAGGAADYVFPFAAPGGRPLAGDYNGGMH